MTPLAFQQTLDDDFDIDVKFSKTHPYFLTGLPKCAGILYRNEIILNDLIFWSLDNSFSTIINDGLFLKIKTHNIASVMAHEIGHFFGLKHNDEHDSIMRGKRLHVDRPSAKDIERLMEIIK